MKDIKVALILPAKDESENLHSVLKSIPEIINKVIVVDNGSIDETAVIAKENGALVVYEPIAGYGRACLAGLKFLSHDPPDIVAFADADGSDDISKLKEILNPIIYGVADFVLEKRIPENKKALSYQQRIGNYLATRLIYFLWNFKYHDLGPMRAIKWESLLNLNMSDKDFGWTVEMQIKALKYNLRVTEIPLPYYKRTGGKSKISKTLNGTLKAGVKILWVVFREAFLGRYFRHVNCSMNYYGSNR